MSVQEISYFNFSPVLLITLPTLRIIKCLTLFNKGKYGKLPPKKASNKFENNVANVGFLQEFYT